MNACDVKAVVFKDGSVILLARVVGGDGTPVTIAKIDDAEYSVYHVDNDFPDCLTVSPGHNGVTLTVADVIFDTLQEDDLWGDTDDEGYNFKYAIDVSETQAFLVADETYLVVVTLTPTSGQDILVRFRVEAI
jgi:hypothetical protein